MPGSKFSYLLLLLIGMLYATGCKKIIQEPVYDNIIYNIDSVYIYSSNAEKDKQKTSAQYISILYADLTNQNIDTKTLTELDELILSIGDKGLAHQLILNAFINSGTANVPTNSAMRADVDAFISDIYRNFYLRKPTEYEKIYLKGLINNDPGLTPEMIYEAFLTSNEYLFY